MSPEEVGEEHLSEEEKNVIKKLLDALLTKKRLQC